MKGRGIMMRKAIALRWAAPALVSFSTVAMAQQEQDSAAAEVGVLEQVTVTAQRRSENLQDVPVALTVLDEKALRAQGVQELTSLAASVPSLTVTRVNNAATPFLRGVGTGVTTPGEDPSVALYVDGVYLPAPQAQLFAFNNIERVEVLKGPQGTLFGRNATAGVIQIISKEPSSTPSANLRVSYGNYDTAEGSFYGTIGVGDGLATDIALTSRNQDSGWGTGAVTGDETYTADEFGARNTWLWTASESTSVRVSLDYTQSDSQYGLPNNFYPGTFGFDGVTSYTGFYNISGSPDGAIDAEQGGLSAQITHDLGWGELVSITSWRKLLSEYNYDQDGTPIRRVELSPTNRDRNITQELQLQSQSDRLQWIVGLYALDNVTSQQNLVQGLLTGVAAYTGSFGEQTTRSYAGFGQATLEVLSDTDLTLGLRYTSDKRDVEGWTEVGPTPTLPAVRTAVPERSRTFSKLTWRLALDHRFTPEVMGYVSYNRGFKAGLWNTSSPTAPSVAPEILDAYEVGLKTELLDHRVRLNGAAFYYDFTDIHVDYIFAGNNNILNAAKARIQGIDLDFQASLGANLTLQGGASYMDGEYTSFVQAPSYIPLQSGGAALAFVNANGNTTVRSPKYTLNVGGTYRIPSAVGNFDLSMNATYNDGFYWQFDNNLRQPSHTLVGTTLAWTSINGKWGIDVWGRNLLGEELYSYARVGGTGAQFSPAPPRMYGVGFTASFD